VWWRPPGVAGVYRQLESNRHIMAEPGDDSMCSPKLGQQRIRRLSEEQQVLVAKFHQEDVILALRAAKCGREACPLLDQHLAALHAEINVAKTVAASKLLQAQRNRRRTMARRLDKLGATLPDQGACFCGEEPPLLNPFFLACGHCACYECAHQWLTNENGCCWICRAHVPQVLPLNGGIGGRGRRAPEPEPTPHSSVPSGEADFAIAVREQGRERDRALAAEEGAEEGRRQRAAAEHTRAVRRRRVEVETQLQRRSAEDAAEEAAAAAAEGVRAAVCQLAEDRSQSEAALLRDFLLAATAASAGSRRRTVAAAADVNGGGLRGEQGDMPHWAAPLTAALSAPRGPPQRAAERYIRRRADELQEAATNDDSSAAGERGGGTPCYVYGGAGRLASGARTRSAFMYAVDVVREHGRG